jgi:hypothetical protein
LDLMTGALQHNVLSTDIDGITASGMTIYAAPLFGWAAGASGLGGWSTDDDAFKECAPKGTLPCYNASLELQWYRGVNVAN